MGWGSDSVAGSCIFFAGPYGPYAGWAQQYLYFSERLMGQQRPRRRQALLDAGAK